MTHTFSFTVERADIWLVVGIIALIIGVALLGLPGALRERRKREKRTQDALDVFAFIEVLREEFGAWVEIPSQSEESLGEEGHTHCVDCIGTWTEWDTKRFTGRTLRDALQAAASAYLEAQHIGRTV